MKNIVLTIVCLVAIVTTYAQNNYFWNNDSKVFMDEDYSQFYLFHYSRELYELLNTDDYREGVISNKEMNLGCVYKEGMEQKLQGAFYATIKSVILDEILQNYDVPYYTPYYKIFNGEEVCSHSNIFMVKLKSEDDIQLLEQQAEQQHVSVIGYNEYMPLWYTLMCFDVNEGSAIEMANKFYESGNFQAVSYDFGGLFKTFSPLELPIMEQTKPSIEVKMISKNKLTVFVNLLYMNHPIQIKIYNLCGQIQYQFQSNNTATNYFELDLSTLNTGVYICKIETDGANHSTKLIIK